MKVDSQKTNLHFFHHWQTLSLYTAKKNMLGRSPKIQIGTGVSPSTIILLQSGITPSLNTVFNLEFKNMRASCTLPGHFITTSKKQ